MRVDLELLERWLSGWSLARGLPLPQRAGGGLVVEVGWPEQLRRHVFVDAGAALQACAAQILQHRVFLKAAVDVDTLRHALPPRWTIERPRYLMYRAMPMAQAVPLPAGYALQSAIEHGAHIIRIVAADGQTAATGGVVLHQGTAIFDRIVTAPAHRRKGLASALMYALDAVAGDADRLLVATDEGRALYLSLGWQELAPYSTAVLAESQPGDD